MLEFTAALRRGAMMTVAVLSMVIGLAVAAVLLVRGDAAPGAWLLPAALIGLPVAAAAARSAERRTRA